MSLSASIKGYLWPLSVTNEKNLFARKHKYHCSDLLFSSHISDYDRSSEFEWIMRSESGINLKTDMFRQSYAYGHTLVTLQFG